MIIIIIIIIIILLLCLFCEFVVVVVATIDSFPSSLLEAKNNAGEWRHWRYLQRPVQKGRTTYYSTSVAMWAEGS